jgi:hypothetical protein
MTTHIYSLLGIVALCVFWAFFQLWLKKVDPAADKRPTQCGGCDEQCERQDEIATSELEAHTGNSR